MLKIDIEQCEYCRDSSICELWGGIECKPEEYKCPYYIKCLELQLHRYKQALERIKDIVTQINFTVAGGDESPKQEWIRLYSSIVYEVSKIINEVK